jgi:tetratricopeptide (TPR) repeat protein
LTKTISKDDILRCVAFLQEVCIGLQGDLVTAQRLLERALAISETTMGAKHSDTVRVVQELAEVAFDRGDLAEARLIWERALADAEQALAPDHIFFALALFNLAFVLRAQGDQGQARELLERVVSVWDEGLQHGDMKQHAQLTVRALDALGRTNEASVLREKYGIGQ